MDTKALFAKLVLEIERAGQIAREYFDASELTTQQKSDGSVVTRADKEIERVIRQFIAEHFPADTVVGEEQDRVHGTSRYEWHIDPIDGTDNFLRKIPFCSISVARLGDGAEGSFGVVHNPITRHTFSSLMEEGVYENDRVAAMTAEPLGGKYVVSSGLGKTEPWMRATRYHLAAAVEQEFGKCQSYGSSALELAYLAAGRIDGYITYGLSTYDYAAGLHLVKAAGGTISTFENGTWQQFEGTIKQLCDCDGKTIFASHPDVHERIRDFIGDPRQWAE